MQSRKLSGPKPGVPAQKYLDIAEIRDDIVILKDGTLRCVLLVSSINFSLKSVDEQNAIVQAYMQFLNGLEFPIQVVIQSRRMNIDSYVRTLNENEKNQTNDLLKRQIHDYREFVRQLVKMGDIMQKRFYVVVPYSSGDKAQDATRFWFDIRANLRREMEDRKKRFDDKNEVRGKLAEVLKKLAVGATFFDGFHIFTPHADLSDDSALRLVFLAPEQFYSREETRMAFDAVLDYVRNNGAKPRYRGNRLVFISPDHGSLTRLSDCIRVALAWGSIVDDVKAGRLNIDQLQMRQAEKELQTSTDVLPRVARECYKWLLCPVQNSSTEPKPSVEVFPLNTSGSALGSEIERVCVDNELVIATWSPIHLRTKLKELYWKADKPAIGAMAFWEDTMRYLYLPRLKSRSVLEQAILKGAASRDFFGTAYGQHDGKFDGFKLGDANIQLDDTLLLIEPEAAKQYNAAQVPLPIPTPEPGYPGTPKPEIPETPQPTPGGAPKAHTFIGTVDVNAATAKMRLVEIADEIISVLASDSKASVKVSVEITADFSEGVSDQIKRAVSENATSLGFKNKTWE